MSIEQMIRELLEAGWTKARFDVWRAPWGSFYRGPAGAWKIMARMERVRPMPPRSSKSA